MLLYFLEVFRTMLPENILKAATDNSQLLGVIIFSILLAAAITRLPAERMKTVQDFFGAMHEAMSIIIGWVMALAPFGDAVACRAECYARTKSTSSDLCPVTTVLAVERKLAGRGRQRLTFTGVGHRLLLRLAPGGQI